MPRNCPANISSPVEYDSSIGYVTSTPNSNPTAIMGIMEAPTTKQQKVTSPASPERKDKEVAAMLITERIDITITDSLYFFLISTQTPNAADPTRPPTMKTAPKTDD
jgi:hypothetical protein